jgi:hypothetical protein
MSDDFEKAVLINFNYGGNIDPQLKVVHPAEALKQHEQHRQCSSSSCCCPAWQTLTLSTAHMSAGTSSSLYYQHQAVIRLLEAVL